MDEIDAIAEACLKAYQVVEEHGTPEMQATMRVLLFQIGEEIVRRQDERRKKLDG